MLKRYKLVPFILLLHAVVAEVLAAPPPDRVQVPVLSRTGYDYSPSLMLTLKTLLRLKRYYTVQLTFLGFSWSGVIQETGVCFLAWLGQKRF